MNNDLVQSVAIWTGTGSTKIIPPEKYWSHLEGSFPAPQLERCRELSSERVNEFHSYELPPPESSAVGLLDQMTADGWLERAVRLRCAHCKEQLPDEQPKPSACLECGEAFAGALAVTSEVVYIRDLAPGRDVDWVIAIHGMNTSGAWQEAFCWYFSTTWGRSVPVAVYKYGIVIAGVILSLRRRALQDSLRDKLAALNREAKGQGFDGKPDVIAHSFGTWLLGRILQEEMLRAPKERLKFGRIILTGCILRPDFDWKRLREAELVDDVLNHYGTKDMVVPLAQATIPCSGPSGRRGFDDPEILNIRAEGFGHSDLFSVDKRARGGAPFQSRQGEQGELSHLEHSYHNYWRPFLTLPREEMYRIPDRVDPQDKWRQMAWPLRGTLFPFFALPLIIALLVLLGSYAGEMLWAARAPAVVLVSLCAGGILLQMAGIAMTWVWRSIRGRC